MDPNGTIPSSSQKQSGIGIQAGGSVGYVKRLADHWQGVLAASATATYYPVVGAWSPSTSESAELRRLIDRGYLGFGAVSTQGFDTHSVGMSYASYGPRVSFAKMLSQRDQLTGNATFLWRQYPESAAFEGTSFTTTGTLVHALDSSANFAVLAGYSKIYEQQAYNSYFGISAGLGFYKELSNGITLEGQGTAMLANFDAETPLINKTREDENLTGSLTLTKRDWNIYGFAPSLNYTYTRNFSNIEVYDYDSHAVDFRLTKKF